LLITTGTVSVETHGSRAVGHTHLWVILGNLNPHKNTQT